MFKWTCFSLALVAVLALGWVVNDVRLEVKRATRAVNDHLPEILAKSKKSADTLAVLSDDIKQLRDLLGSQGTRDKSLVAYADSLLDLVAASGGLIGVEKLFGKDLKDPVPAAEWVVSARREAAVQAFRVRTRQELLARLSQNKFGSPWLLQIGDEPPQPLEAWLREHHAASRELPPAGP